MVAIMRGAISPLPWEDWNHARNPPKGHSLELEIFMQMINQGDNTQFR